MKIFIEPARSEWAQIIQRPQIDHLRLVSSVSDVLEAVKTAGDQAVMKFTADFDGVQLTDFRVSDQEWSEAEDLISSELKAAIDSAAANIEAFHKTQAPETAPPGNPTRRPVLA